MEILEWNTEMLVSGIILTLTFIGIFTEGVHGFHRAKFALGGTGTMVPAGQYCSNPGADANVIIVTISEKLAIQAYKLPQAYGYEKVRQ